jgi:hypothetical protein
MDNLGGKVYFPLFFFLFNINVWIKCKFSFSFAFDSIKEVESN